MNIIFSSMSLDKIIRISVDKERIYHGCFHEPRSCLLSSSRIVVALRSSCLGGTQDLRLRREGSMRRARWNGRGQSDARDEEPAGPPREKDTKQLCCLYGDKSEYTEPIRTRRVIPCRSYAPFVGRGAHP